MTKSPMDLQNLRRRIHVKAKAEPSWRFWGLHVHVCKFETLHAAYRLARDNNGAPGIDGVTFAAIEAGGEERMIEGLREELVQGTYRPLRVRKVEIPKDGGISPLLSNIYLNEVDRMLERAKENTYRPMGGDRVREVCGRPDRLGGLPSAPRLAPCGGGTAPARRAGQAPG